MSNNPRCKDCDHKRDPRVTALMAQADAKQPYVHGEQLKKKACGCKCHE